MQWRQWLFCCQYLSIEGAVATAWQAETPPQLEMGMGGVHGFIPYAGRRQPGSHRHERAARHAGADMQGVLHWSAASQVCFNFFVAPCMLDVHKTRPCKAPALIPQTCNVLLATGGDRAAQPVPGHVPAAEAKAGQKSSGAAAAGRGERERGGGAGAAAHQAAVPALPRHRPQHPHHRPVSPQRPCINL